MSVQEIQSIGPPPERHADRVVAEMIRQFAQKHARVWCEIARAIDSSSDGSPKAQRKMAERILRAGANSVELTPGKRGRYLLMIHDLTGWNPQRDDNILLGDPIPERPWIAYNITKIESVGGGSERLAVGSCPLILISHHCLSRVAQRFGMRTTEHMLLATKVIWNETLRFLEKKLEQEKAPLETPPLGGWRVPLDKDGAIVVLKRHARRRASFVATTAF
jgi:hypothetical protein